MPTSTKALTAPCMGILVTFLPAADTRRAVRRGQALPSIRNELCRPGAISGRRSVENTTKLAACCQPRGPAAPRPNNLTCNPWHVRYRHPCCNSCVWLRAGGALHCRSARVVQAAHPSTKSAPGPHQIICEPETSQRATKKRRNKVTLATNRECQECGRDLVGCSPLAAPSASHAPPPVAQLARMQRNFSVLRCLHPRQSVSQLSGS